MPSHPHVEYELDRQNLVVVRVDATQVSLGVGAVWDQVPEMFVNAWGDRALKKLIRKVHKHYNDPDGILRQHPEELHGFTLVTDMLFKHRNLKRPATLALAMKMFFTGKVDNHGRKLYEQYLFFMTMDEFMPIVPKLDTVLVYGPNSQFFGWQNRASNGGFSQN